MSVTFRLVNEKVRSNAIHAVCYAADGVEVIIRKPKRNLDQNALMWAALTDIADQVVWYGEKLTKEEWKDVLTAAWKRQKVVRGIDGGFVVIGARTSEMSKSEMAEFMELAFAFGAEQGVKFSESL